MKKKISILGGILYIMLSLYPNINVAYAKGDETIDLENTEELEICVEENEYDQGTIKKAIEEYQKLYPDVNIIIRKLPYAGYAEGEILRKAEVTKIKTEIMSGEGSDLFLLHSGRSYVCGNTDNLFEDLEKTARTGVFENLSVLFEGENAVDSEEYYEFALEAGRIEGKQIFLPLSFNFRGCLTSEKNLIDSGFDCDKAEKSMQMFHEEILKCFNEQERADLGISYYKNMSSPVIDYDTGKIHIGKEEKQYFEWSKEDYLLSKEYEHDISLSDKYDQEVAKNIIIGKTKMKGGILETEPLGIMLSAQIMAEEGENPIFIKIPDENGKTVANIKGYVAVNENSKNKKNAFNFIKLLLSEEMQIEGAYPSAESFPIRKGKDVIKKIIDKKCQEDSLNNVEVNSLTDITVDSIMHIVNDIETAHIQEIYEIPLEGSKKYSDYIMDYMENEMTYEEFSEVVTEKLEFYLEE